MIFSILFNYPLYTTMQTIINTPSYSHQDLPQTRAVVEAESENIIQWFDFNNMQANPEKFQAIVWEERPMMTAGVLEYLVLITEIH